MLHSPNSTPNAVTYLETGTVPIQYEIHKRQLNFLHHILSLEVDDPVQKMYRQLLRYPYESNWSNEILSLRKQYNLHQTDEEITQTNRKRWKKLVITTVHKIALHELNDQMRQLKKCHLPEYQKLAVQEYMVNLRPQQARAVFQIRAGVVDLKTIRHYAYQDTVCRLCNQNDEDIDHVVNTCPRVARTNQIRNVSTTIDIKDLEEIAERFLDFTNKIAELDLD
jgi:hypothetical protein